MFVTRFLFCIAVMLCVRAQAATFQGRVQYESSKTAAKVLVEARSYGGPNLLFWVPRESHTVLASVSTRSDGRFTFHLPDNVRRLRFTARGSFTQGKQTRWNCKITRRAVTLNTIILPNDFRPWHPGPQPWRLPKKI